MENQANVPKTQSENSITPLESTKGRHLNILILGETGVGKSTWINAFRNFLSFESLQEAEENQLLNLIPTKFTVLDENYKAIQVTTGSDSNESFQDGESSTQQARVYQFRVDSTTVSLIDTPGVGDIRGIAQDEENFKNILDTIKEIDKLDAICILLKPNNARLSVTFRYCIQELLKFLGKGASQNIVFCFTNSRETFFRPGDTLNALESLLKSMDEVDLSLSKETVYCFDSEAYRYLAGIKNDPPVTFTTEEREDFVKSWERSMLETTRMMEHILKLKPFPVQVKDTSHLVRVVAGLIKPMAESLRDLQITPKPKVEKATKAPLPVPSKIERKLVQLDQPKLLCHEKGCVESGRVCEEQCSVGGIPENAVGSFKLYLNCKRISIFGGVCKSCKHSFRKHYHLHFESKQIFRHVTEVENHLQSGAGGDDPDADEDRSVKERKSEMGMICKISAQLSRFLEENSMVPRSDEIEQDLTRLIEEKKGNGSGGDGAALSLTLRKYLELKEISGKTQVTPDDIEAMIDQLKGLKYSGSRMRMAVDYLEKEKDSVKVPEIGQVVQIEKAKKSSPLRIFFAKLR